MNTKTRETKSGMAAGTLFPKAPAHTVARLSNENRSGVVSPWV